jgi:hypothetical protein
MNVGGSVLCWTSLVFNKESMMQRTLYAAALLVLAPLTVYAQDAAQTQYDSAYYAWDAGNYVDAIGRLQRLLRGPNAQRFLEPIALLTGELYSTTEIVPPNRYVVNVTQPQFQPKWSADGRYFAFETTSGATRTGHIYRVEGNNARPVAQVNGYGLAFATDGSRVAFLRVTEDADLRAARAAGGGRGGRGGGGGAVAALEAAKAVVIERDLNTGQETTVDVTGVTRAGLTYASNGQLFLTGVGPGSPETQVFRIGDTAPLPLTAGADAKRAVAPVAGGRVLVSVGANAFGILEPGSGQLRAYGGTSLSLSANGEAVAYIGRDEQQNVIYVLPVGDARPIIVKRTPAQIANPVVSPNGQKVVFQMMPRDDWELYSIDITGENERRLTREIQHDHTPRLLTNDLLLGVMGENRHRRSYVYDLQSGARTRLFHNNQIRTVSMEYAWSPSPDGSKVLIVADRDGDTISPERGVYLVDLTRKVTTQDLLARTTGMLAAESDLRARGQAMFAPIAARVRAVLADASVARVYGYEKAMYDFDSKYITQPGNPKASEYIFNTLKSFGYEPEYQWFEPRPGVRTANVIATLRGSRDPDLVYVVSSHYDSVERGPGADDDTSGSAALLEAARLLVGKPMPATIKFAWFTGEEAGLLGSREFVRQAVASGMKIIGALNNDMIGYANDHRLDNTIRYSNVGLRDVQHAAAFTFTNLITFDSKYYQSTDAAAYFDAYGDIVGGIGSYPILGSPHYHQSHDILENMNHQLITEVAKTTVATLMLMASSPARLKDVTAVSGAAGVEVKWTPAVESGITGYIVAVGPTISQLQRQQRVTAPRVTLAGLKPGDVVWVKAVNAQGMQSWDWARAVVQ